MNSTFINFVHIFVKSGLSITTTEHIETHILGQDLNVTYTPGILEYFDKYSYYKTVDKNGHHKEMELDADPRPTDQWPQFWKLYLQLLLSHHDFYFWVYQFTIHSVQWPRV